MSARTCTSACEALEGSIEILRWLRLQRALKEHLLHDIDVVEYAWNMREGNCVKREGDLRPASAAASDVS